MYVNYLAPVTDQKNLRCGRLPHTKQGQNIVFSRTYQCLGTVRKTWKY